MSSHVQVEFVPPGLRVNDYDPIAVYYDQVMGDDFAGLVIDDLWAAAQLRLPPSGGGRFLDLGCGSAAVLARVASRTNAECFGVDLSAEQIKWARRRLDSAGIQATLSVGDVLSVDLPQQCNVITMNLDALNHLTDPEKWLVLFKRVFSTLGKGGVFWFDVNTPERLQSDWDYPEVILKERLTYVQCPVSPCPSGEVARRRLLMHIFVEIGETTHRHSTLVEHIALPTDQVLTLLRLAGFRDARQLALNPAQATQHIFLKNRDFIQATK